MLLEARRYFSGSSPSRMISPVSGRRVRCGLAATLTVKLPPGIRRVELGLGLAVEAGGDAVLHGVVARLHRRDLPREGLRLAGLELAERPGADVGGVAAERAADRRSTRDATGSARPACLLALVNESTVTATSGIVSSPALRTAIDELRRLGQVLLGREHGRRHVDLVGRRPSRSRPGAPRHRSPRQARRATASDTARDLFRWLVIPRANLPRRTGRRDDRTQTGCAALHLHLGSGLRGRIWCARGVANAAPVRVPLRRG